VKIIPSKEKQSCINRKISHLHDTRPDMSDKQIIAVAYSECGASKSDFKPSEYCPYRVLSKIKLKSKLERDLYTGDFSILPTSIRIARSVDEYLPQLRSDFPKKKEKDLLIMAYNIAKGILDNSDFVTVEEKPVFFEIYLDGIQMEEFEKQMRVFFAQNADDFTDDNTFKIEMKDISKVKMSHELTEQDLEEEKRKIFTKVAKKDIKNVPPIFIDKKNKIWDGHHRYLTLKLAGFDVIPVIQLPVSILREIEDYNDFLKGWDIKQNSNENVTQFDTELNRYLKEKGLISDFTDDKAADPFFAPDTKVSSSNVAEVGYDRGRLRIFFNNGWGYEYDVPSSWYVEMINAPSKGQYVWDTLRGRKPGRVIDKPNKTTPGGVGGSIVPYFKIKGARMPQEAMRKSVRGFLKSVRKEGAQVGAVPIRQITKPKFREFTQFLKTAGGPAKKPTLFTKIKGLFKQKKNDFTDDFVNDMKYFSGPITRPGDFEYNEGVKIKDFENLKEISSKYSHLPSFDSHNENQILGFAYNLTSDPDKYMKSHPKYEELKQHDYIYAEGYSFQDIENVAELPVDSNTELPVSIRFQDANEGLGLAEQHITDLVHLAISVNRTEQDRCSTAGGNPCFVSFQDKQDFSDSLEQTPEGKSMPSKEEKEEKKEEEEEKPPKSDTKGESPVGKKKQDPPMDAEYEVENKKAGKKSDMKETEDFVKIPRAAWQQVNKDVSDMKEREKVREAAYVKRELESIKSDFADVNQVYKIKNDFIKSADLKTMQILKEGLVKTDIPINAGNQLFNQDYSSGLDKIDDFQKALEKRYNVVGSGN
jgi:hypothetical protein